MKSVAGWYSQWSSKGGAHDGVISVSDDGVGVVGNPIFPCFAGKHFRDMRNMALVTRLFVAGPTLKHLLKENRCILCRFCMFCYHQGAFEPTRKPISLCKINGREFRAMKLLWIFEHSKTNNNSIRVKVSEFPTPKVGVQFTIWETIHYVYYMAVYVHTAFFVVLNLQFKQERLV